MHTFILLIICLITHKEFLENAKTSMDCHEINGTLAQKDTTIDDFYSDITTSVADFDFSEDIFAIVHIQETSSVEWELHIWKNLEMRLRETDKWAKACFPTIDKNSYSCYKNKLNKPILWNRYIDALSDIHADYTELTNRLAIEYKYHLQPQTKEPLMQGIVHFVTFLRNPVSRYISEFDEIKKGKIFV